MPEHVLSLFDASNYPARNGDTSKVVALCKNAIPASTDKRDDGSPTGSATREVLIGTLVWYSVSDAVRLTPSC